MPGSPAITVRRRLRVELVCSYCRDTIARGESIRCSRPGCCSRYHRECWEECSERFGGCAVLGCTGTCKTWSCSKTPSPRSSWSLALASFSFAGFLAASVLLVLPCIIFTRCMYWEHGGRGGIISRVRAGGSLDLGEIKCVLSTDERISEISPEDVERVCRDEWIWATLERAQSPSRWTEREDWSSSRATELDGDFHPRCRVCGDRHMYPVPRTWKEAWGYDSG